MVKQIVIINYDDPEIKNKVIFLFLLSLISYEVIATSCAPLFDKVIAKGNGSTYNKLFVVSEIKSIGSCKRRPQDISPPKWSKSLVEYDPCSISNKL